MSLSELKFEESDFEGQDIASLDDRPKISAAELKARFDNIGKVLLALGRFNQLLDSLISGDALADICVPDMEDAALNEVLASLSKAVQELAEKQQGQDDAQQEQDNTQQEQSESLQKLAASLQTVTEDLEKMADTVQELAEAQQEQSETLQTLGETLTQELAGVVRSVNGIGSDEDGNVTIPDGDEVSY